MSFGIGVGDVVVVSTLAWRMYRACKDSLNDFRNISSEVLSLHVILKELQDNASDEILNGQQQAQLDVLGSGCNDVLKDLDSLLKKYQSLGLKSQRSNVSLLTAFNTTLQAYVTTP